MQAGREISHVLHSSEDVAQRRSGFQAPRSVENSVKGGNTSSALCAGRKFDQAELSSLPPSSHELVRRGREAEHMKLKPRDLDLAGHLKPCRAERRSDVELFDGRNESSGTSFRARLPVARVRVIPARRD